MLDEKDLQAIQAMMDAMEQRTDKKLVEMEQRTDKKLVEMEQRTDKKLAGMEQHTDKKLAEMEQRITKSIVALMDAEFAPKFNLLAEGIQDIQEKLVPRSRVDDLEEEVKFLKSIVRQMNEDLQQLKKAQ